MRTFEPYCDACHVCHGTSPCPANKTIRKMVRLEAPVEAIANNTGLTLGAVYKRLQRLGLTKQIRAEASL